MKSEKPCTLSVESGVADCGTLVTRGLKNAHRRWLSGSIRASACFPTGQSFLERERSDPVSSLLGTHTVLEWPIGTFRSNSAKYFCWVLEELAPEMSNPITDRNAGWCDSGPLLVRVTMSLTCPLPVSSTLTVYVVLVSSVEPSAFASRYSTNTVLLFGPAVVGANFT